MHFLSKLFLNFFSSIVLFLNLSEVFTLGLYVFSVSPFIFRFWTFTYSFSYSDDCINERDFARLSPSHVSLKAFLIIPLPPVYQTRLSWTKDVLPEVYPLPLLLNNLPELRGFCNNWAFYWPKYVYTPFRSFD